MPGSLQLHDLRSGPLVTQRRVRSTRARIVQLMIPVTTTWHGEVCYQTSMYK